MDMSKCYDCMRRCLYLCETHPAYRYGDCEAFCNARCYRECPEKDSSFFP
jgi:hypothetical protein